MPRTAEKPEEKRVLQMSRQAVQRDGPFTTARKKCDGMRFTIHGKPLHPRRHRFPHFFFGVTPLHSPAQEMSSQEPLSLRDGSESGPFAFGYDQGRVLDLPGGEIVKGWARCCPMGTRITSGIAEHDRS
jgi:hypothetical protein